MKTTDPQSDNSRAQVTAEQLAELFHETYERLAPDFNYKTRQESAVPWEEVPINNRSLMIAVAREMLQRFDIQPIRGGRNDCT
jgi:hypothetical protein